MAAKRYRIALVMLPLILAAGLAVWVVFFTLGASDAQTKPETAFSLSPEPTEPQSETAPAIRQNGTDEATAAEPAGHLRISRQSFARGGLGSKALITFTLRNDNRYTVRDPEILCSFRSKDGHYSTERRRTISDTVNSRSRKTFPYTFIGFVNIKASTAKCSVLSASRE